MPSRQEARLNECRRRGERFSRSCDGRPHRPRVGGVGSGERGAGDEQIAHGRITAAEDSPEGIAPADLHLVLGPVREPDDGVDLPAGVEVGSEHGDGRTRP